MQKPCRNEKLSAILKAELFGKPASEIGAAFANINSHIKQPTACTANKLGLRVGRSLTMKTSHRANLARHREIVLHKLTINPLSQ